MRNLIAFFIRYNSFFIFLALEVICLIMVIRLNYYHEVTFYSAANKVTGGIYSSYSELTDYLNLATVNDSLNRENARLRSQLAESYWDNTEKKDVACDLDMVQAYQYFDAKVISNSTTAINNYLVINRGSKHGVEKNMGVVVPNGVVGIVMDVSENFATVMSVLHKDSKISVKLKTPPQNPGNLSWSGGDSRFASLKGIPTHIKVAKGDTIITSGFSSIFPENIMIGTIEGFEELSGTSNYDITVRLSTSFETLEYVYVVNYLFAKEQRQLEAGQKE